MSKELTCKQCGCTDIELDDRRGQYYCTRCATICGESNLTPEIQFSRAGAQGKFVAAGASSTYFGASRYRSLTDQAALKRAKAHKLLKQIGSQLKIRESNIDAAKRVYELAQENNFTQGRHSKVVAGSALYIICRKEKLPYMLIDFADVLGVSLYSLAACFIKLVRLLNLSSEIPQIDPSLFIHRFCSKLEFGDKERDVSLTALRLMQSFKRDWITQGRRPAGLCGAAIRIAASFHGFKRSTKQIINVVKVCEETVKKRIDEFKATPIASLTQEAFDAIDFNSSSQPTMNPPSFTKRKDMKLEDLVNSQEVRLQLEHSASEMDIELKKEPVIIENQLVPAVEISKEVEEVKMSENKVVAWKSETLSDIDDEEVGPYLLSEKEVTLKTAIWESMNTEWLRKNTENKKALKRHAKNTPIKRKKKKLEQEKIKEEIIHPIQMLQSFSRIGAKGFSYP
jgi:transcription factor IIIB subunit 2